MLRRFPGPAPARPRRSRAARVPAPRREPRHRARRGRPRRADGSTGARLATPGVCCPAPGSRRRRRPAARRDARIRTSDPACHMDARRGGYDQAAEDELLRVTRLGTRTAIACSSGDPRRVLERGWFVPIGESNALFMPAAMWTGARRPRRAVRAARRRAVQPRSLPPRVRVCDGAELVVLLGEGTFHQIHGGVATNRPAAMGSRLSRGISADLRGGPRPAGGRAPLPRRPAVAGPIFDRGLRPASRNGPPAMTPPGAVAIYACSGRRSWASNMPPKPKPPIRGVRRRERASACRPDCRRRAGPRATRSSGRCSAPAATAGLCAKPSRASRTRWPAGPGSTRSPGRSLDAVNERVPGDLVPCGVRRGGAGDPDARQRSAAWEVTDRAVWVADPFEGHLLRRQRHASLRALRNSSTNGSLSSKGRSARHSPRHRSRASSCCTSTSPNRGRPAPRSRPFTTA